MRLVKRLLLWTFCLCIAVSPACAMGLNVTQPEAWKLRVSWSDRLDVSKVALYTGSNVLYSSQQASGTSAEFQTVAPLGTYRIKAFDAKGNVVAEAGEVTGNVGRWSKYGAVTGICEIVRRTDADESKSVWEVSHPTVTNITSDLLNQYMDQGIRFYLHWKVQFKQQSYAQSFRTDLVMHTPSGAIYTDSWTTNFDTDLNAGGHWNCYPSVSGASSDVFNKYRNLNSTWEKGKYTFYIYADGLLIQDCVITVK